MHAHKAVSETAIAELQQCAQLAQWLRLEAIWEPGSQIMPERVTAWGREGWMCRIYLCVSLGMLQPLFLLTAMLLCQQSVRYDCHRRINY